MPASGKKTAGSGVQKPAKKAPPKPAKAMRLLPPALAVWALAFGGIAGGACVATDCVGLLSNAALPPIPTLPPVPIRSAVAVTPSPSPFPESVPGSDPLSAALSVTLPERVLLDVPFSAQAPLGGTWTELHNEACEEASLLMAAAFLRSEASMPRQATDRAIRDFVAWQQGNGYAVDLTAEQMAETATKYLRLSAQAYGPAETTETNIKKLLAAGHPVIVPAAGKKLPNPYYTPPGPDYHALVIIGYDGTDFIVNDPGTRRGAKYRYAADTLMDAIHDWTGNKKTVGNGPKAMLVVTSRASGGQP